MFAYSAAKNAGCTLPFTRNPVFVAVTAAVGSTEFIAIKRLVVRLATDVFGTDLGHSAFNP